MARSLFFIVLFSFVSSWAQYSKSVAIPLKTIKKPAADLLGSDGQVMDVGAASGLAEKGFDLSTLNPQDDRLWQDKKYPGVDAVTDTFPSPEPGVVYQSTEATRFEVFTHQSRVIDKTNSNGFFRLTLSRLSHNTLMRAVLLRKLGYYLPNPRYYKKLRVYFSDEAQKTTYIEEVEKESVIVDLKDRKWILEDDTKNHSLLLADLILESANPDYYDIANGTAPDPIIARATVERLSRYRAFRALILPFTLVDIPESINRYSPKLASVLAGHVIFTYPYAPSFGASTYEDVRWLTRRLMQLTEQDLHEVVAAGEFPSELIDLVYAKLVYRVRNAGEMFDLNSDFHLTLPNLFINSPSGLVKDGKVTSETVPGYPIRFAHGDRESPFKAGDFGRYLGVRGRTSAIATAVGEINKRLQLLTVNDLASSHLKDLQNQIIDHIRNHPRDPLYQKVEAWGGPVAGLNLSATRNVSTGTYYDSTAPIQLVDNISVSAQLGYFMSLDGVPNVTPFGGANLSVTRDYTHVRPITSMTDGSSVPWKNLLVPAFMKKIAGVLVSEKTDVDSPEGKIQRYSVDSFLTDLREGEVFTITDSLTTSLYGQLSAGLDALMGIAPLNFLNSVSLGADANRVVLRQTNLMRTSDGVQILVRQQKGQMYGVTLDVNYLINILKIRAQTQSADLHTDAFVIKYDPAMSDDTNSGSQGGSKATDLEKTRSTLRPALLNLFRNNDPDLFYNSFKYQKFEIDHKLNTKELQVKAGLMRMSRFNEDHWAEILYPRAEDAPDLNPKDEKVILFANKCGELAGRDLLGLAADLVTGLINKGSKVNVDLGQANDPNPANTPYGKAYWRMADTEADLSPKGQRYPNVALLSHVWGGWHLKRQQFFNLLNEISSQFKNTKIGSYRLIEPEAFMNVQSVDFYRINAMVSVLPDGLKKIKNLIIEPSAKKKPMEKYGPVSRIFQMLSEKVGNGPQPQEPEMYKQVVKILGNGDQAAGEAIFRQACVDSKQSDVPNNYTGAWQDGNFFQCLTPWMISLMKLSATYPAKDEAAQVRWTTQVLYLLDQYIPIAQLLKYLGEPNFIFTVRINGFRTGDEDADLQYFSNSIGDPKQNIDYANGLFQMFANKTGIAPVELDRTLGGFK
jgi:hypothetical protein